jgi:hypothetical protein
MTEALQSFIHKTIKQYIDTRYKQIDNLILEYLFIHQDVSIDDIELVEKRMSDTDIIWYVRKRGSDD